MNPVDVDFTCQCGHATIQHNFGQEWDDSYGYYGRTECRWTGGQFGPFCLCTEYKQDNLKHLERMHDAKRSAL